MQFYADEKVYQLIVSAADVALFSFGGLLGRNVGFATIGINNNSEIDNLGYAFVPFAENYNMEYIELPSIVLYSSTDGSQQKFKITVDDSGTISAKALVPV